MVGTHRAGGEEKPWQDVCARQEIQSESAGVLELENR